MTEITLEVKAVLFDCDGVLVDSDASVNRAWSQWAVRYGLDPEQVAEQVHGRRAADSVCMLIAPTGRAEALSVINSLELDDAATVGSIAGAPELVRQLPDDVWAVVTSGTRELSQARLAAAQIPRPRVLITADDIEDGKPAPDGYLAAAAALGFSPADTVVIEDSRTGIDAARRAGVAYVVGLGAKLPSRLADVVVPDLRSLAWNGGLVIRR